MPTIKEHFALILTGIIAFFMVVIATLAMLLQTPLPIPNPGVVFELAPGVGVKVLAKQLEEQEVITHPGVFEWYTRMNGHDTALKAGEYYFPQGISTREVAKKLLNGQVIKRTLRIHEGWTIHDLITELQNQPLIRHTLDYSDPNWFGLMMGSDSLHPEGQFMPDTYFYSKGISDKRLLKRMHDDLQKYLDAQWEARDPQVPYQNSYQALVAASIIEKETAIPTEREAISGVLMRRLKLGMRLQMDPTVIYGLGQTYTGKITKNDLKNPTPYNTYLINGLPPTPIALPSRQSIHAALHPMQGSSLYFVAKGDGSHTFSDTLEDHNAAVLKYLQNSSASEKKSP